MGLTYADITLFNTYDLTSAKKKLIPESDVKQVTVKALVDSGAYMLTISDTMKRQLDLEVMETLEVELADGSFKECEIAGPVDVRFKTRRTTCDAIVLPGATEVLLGAIPLEAMDVIIDLKNQELTLPPDRPYMARIKIKSVAGSR